YAKFQPFSGGSGDYTLYQSQAQEIAVRIHQGNFSLQGISLSHYYPVVIGYIYALTLPEEIIGLMLNVWLVAISVVFVYLIILEIGGAPKNAFTIGLIAAIYPSYVFDSGLLLKDTLETFFIILGLLFLLKVIKKFTWYNFIVLYLAIIATTHFRFYVGYALIAAFILSWFLFSKIDFKKRIIYGIIFIILSGFIPQIVVGDGYYGINSLRSYLSSKTLNFYRQVAYNPVYNQKPVVSNPVVVSKPVASNPVVVSKPVASNPVVVSKPVVSIPISTVGMDSSFKVGNGPIGYTESFVYVLLGPFPWQIKNLRQSLALFETFPWYLLLFFIIDGIIVCFKKRIKVAAPLLIFSIVTMVVIAVFETNFGLIARVRIPAFTALLCFASFGLNKNNILYNYLQKNYEKIFSYGRSRFYRQPPG
ncbi:MAG: glycosyltransferase family 39 protein, partial [Candidatus Staskawiczbacteria bacterium]